MGGRLVRAGWGIIRRFSQLRGAFSSTPGIYLAMMALLLAALCGPAAAADKYAALVIDANTDRVLYSRNANQPRYPASLTKIMTLYVLFEELDAGRLTLSTPLKVSAHAANQKPSRLGLKPGSTIKTKDAILALVTKSANDVAVVVAEHIEGRESAFATRMTSTARKLGMSRTRFVNASGLPDHRQVTTAQDMATLAIHIQQDFPHHYHYFSTENFSWNGRRYRNHNNLLGKYRGTTGIKTGYINQSGFNLTAAVERDGKHLIGVVLGGKQARSRDSHMVSILDQAFPRATAIASSTSRIAAANTPVPLAKPGLFAAPLPMVLAQAAQLPTASIPASASIPTPNRAERTERTAPTLLAPREQTPAEPARTSPALASDALATATIPAHLVTEESNNWLITPARAHTGTQQVASLTDISQPERQASISSQVPGRLDGPLFPPNSWLIQIGAFASSADAVDSIRHALTLAPAELGTVVPITVPVKTATQTLYRSRFGGFTDEGHAKSACGRLVRENLSCIAIPPSSWSVPARKRG